MIGFRIAVQTSCLAQPFKKALHTAAELGCEGVQIDARTEVRPAEFSDTGLRQLRKMLDEGNLRVAAISLQTRRGLSSSQDLDRRVQATVEALRFASRLGSRILVCTLGTLPDEESAPERATLADVLATLSVQSLRWGVRLAAQTGGASPRTLADFLAKLPEGSLGLDLHPAQLISQGIAPADYVQMLGAHIAHVHAVDAVRDLAGGGGAEVQLGRGTADFPALVGLLEEHGYREWLTIERRHSRQPVEDAASAVQYLRSL